MLKTIGPDDYMILAAMTMGVGVLICFVGETQNGIGRHIQYISAVDMGKILHWQFFHSLWIMMGISFVKMSVGFFLLRLVAGRWYKRFLTGMIGKFI